MRDFLDTNVLVAACLEDHEHHSRAVPIVKFVHQKGSEGFISAHSLIETHSVLTRLPRVPRISSMQASALISDNFVSYFSVVALTGKEYSELSRKLGQDNIIGGQAYDMIHLECAKKCEADRFFTFNFREFARIAGFLRDKITAP